MAAEPIARRDGAARLAGRREWLGLAVLALPGLLISLDFSVLTLAVPKVSEALHPTGTELLWMVDIYGFLLAGLLVTMGALGDRIGRRRLLMLGASAFGAASVLAAYSTSAVMLIAARALLGITGATLLPSTLALISTMFPDETQRGKAIAVWSISLPIGGAIGPLVGGALLDSFWWGSAFLIGVPVMAVLVISGSLLLPEYRDPKGTLPDLLSVVLSLTAVLAIIYGLQEIATGGAKLPASVAVIGGVAATVLFIARQRRLEDPLVDVRLFRTSTFTAALTANTFSYFVILGTLMLFAQYLQLVLGLSALEAGLWTVPAMGGLIVGSLLTPQLVKRARPATVMAGGLGVAAAGFALLSRVGPGDDLSLVVTASAIFCVGLAPVTTLVVNLVLTAAPHERAGAAAGLSETTTELGGALGIAVLGTIAAAVYRDRLTNHVPRSLSSAARHAARDTLGGAVDAARHLPAQAGRVLVSEAQHGFGAGLRVAAATSAAIVLVLASVTLALFRHARTDAEPAVPAALSLPLENRANPSTGIAR